MNTNNCDFKRQNYTNTQVLVAKNMVASKQLVTSQFQASSVSIDKLQAPTSTVDILNVTGSLNVQDVLHIDESKLLNFSDERLLDSTHIVTQLDTLDSTQRTLYSKLYDTVSVKDFGAIGDGIADDYQSIQAAFDYTGNVYFPEGTYNCSNTIIVSEKLVNICGAGNNVSKIVFTENVARGVDISMIYPQTVSISNIIIQSLGDWTGTAVYIRFNYMLIDLPNISNLYFVYINNVLITGERIPVNGNPASYDHGWANGIHFYNCWNVLMTSTCLIAQQATNEIKSQYAIVIDGDDQVSNYHFNSVLGSGWDIVVMVSPNPAFSVSGMFFSNIAFGGNYGIRWNSNTAQSMFILSDSHIAVFKTVVEIYNVQQCFISDNLLYLITSTVTPPTDQSIFLNIHAPQIYNIHDNIFLSYVSNAIQTPIFITLNNDHAPPQPHGVQTSILRNNQFVNGSGIAVDVGIVLTDSDGCELRQNKFIYFNSATDTSIDLGPSTNIVVGKPTCRLTLSGNTTSSGSSYIIPFNTVEYQNPFQGSAPNPTNSLQIPIGLGYRRCKLTGQVTFSNEAGGIRALDILKNGSTAYSGVGSSMMNGDVNATVHSIVLEVSTGILEVEAGDYFQLQLFNDSGVDLTVFGLTETWLNITIIE